MASTIYWDQMFNWSGAASSTLVALYSGVTSTAGTYSPQLDGTLIKVQIILNPQAATSLCQLARVELSQTNWTPNLQRFAVAGFGLATAPQAFAGNQVTEEFLVNQAVNTSQPITGNHIEYYSPVTPNIIVNGCFSA